MVRKRFKGTPTSFEIGSKNTREFNKDQGTKLQMQFKTSFWQKRQIPTTWLRFGLSFTK